MSRKIIGVTVGTPMNPLFLKDKLKPVTSVNGVRADENGNVQIAVSGGSLDAYIEGETLVFTKSSSVVIENETLYL